MAGGVRKIFGFRMVGGVGGRAANQGCQRAVIIASLLVGLDFGERF